MSSAFFTSFKKLKIELFYVLMAAYFFLCIYYAFERMLNMDSSLQLFQIINYKNFFFQENRFGVWLTQLPLLFSIYIHLPIKFLVYIYSISFPLEYLLIIWVNYKVFKSREAALATILSLIFGVAFTFYHSITETHQLLALSCLLYGLLQSKERFIKAYIFYIALILLLIWCLFTHPNAVFTISFVVGLAFLQKKISRFDLLLSIFLSLVFIAVKIYLTHKDSYDSKQYDQLLNFKETLPHFFSLYSFRFLYTKLSTIYLAGSFVVIMVLIKYKRFNELLFCTICFLIFTVLTILTFSNGDCDAIMEKSFMPGFFMFILLYCILLYQAKNKFIYYIIALLLSFSSFINIVNAGKPHTQRLNLLSEIMKKMDKQTPKLIVSYSDFDETLKFNHWATSLDVLIFSLCKSDTAKTIFYIDNKYTYAADTTNPNLFLYLPWNPRGIKTFNTVYFNLPNRSYKLYNNPKKIYLKSRSGKFVCTDVALKNIAIANRDNASDWETFYLITLGNDKIAIQSFDHHNYVCAELNNQSEIWAPRDKIGPWETFTLVKLDSNFVALKAANGKYVIVNEKSLQLYASGDSIGKQEKFEMIFK
jgi:hypothetical protein